MDLRMIPRAYVSIVLGVLRRPVEMAEKLFWSGHDHRPWPVGLAFEGFEADAKTLAGAVLNDRVLIDDGRRQRAKVAELRRADELEAYAEQTRERAEDELEARQQEDQRRIEAAAAREEQQRKAAEERAAARKTAARKRAADEARAESEFEGAVDQTLRRQERDARLSAIAKERRAVAEKRSALATEERADEVDTELDRSKAARRARS